MLDDRTTGSAADDVDPLVGEFVWTRANNQYAWRAYLGDAEPVAPQVPARLDDFRGPPPCWLCTVSMDLFRDENIEYAKNLLRAGVCTGVCARCCVSVCVFSSPATRGHVAKNER